MKTRSKIPKPDATTTPSTARKVTCPQCGAIPGQACTSGRRAGVPTPIPHAARVRRAIDGPPAPPPEPPPIFVVYWRTRHWDSGVSVYRTREAAEANAIRWANEIEAGRHGTDAKTITDYEDAQEAINAAEHELSIYGPVDLDDDDTRSHEKAADERTTNRSPKP